MIQTNRLTKIYLPPPFSRQSSHTALKEVTFRVDPGKIYALLGPNGAGKSTLLRILAGVLPASEGSFRLSGTVGLFMADMRGFWGFMNGRANLSYFCALQNVLGKDALKTIDAMIDLFEMRSFADKPVHSYSAGMRQRLGLARTLLHDPDILLLDEPMTHLDPQAAREFHLLIRDRLNRGLNKTVLLATHQLEEAQEVSDTLGLLFQGRLLWEKDATLFRSHRENLLEQYLKSVREGLK